MMKKIALVFVSLLASGLTRVIVLAALIGASIILLFANSFVLIVEQAVLAWQKIFGKKADRVPELKGETATQDPNAIIVITVHGTFAASATWPLQQNNFFNIVAQKTGACKRDVKWCNFKWTGANTFSARETATVKLVSVLDDIFTAFPDRHVILIGHSHGGNIATKAAESHLSAKNLRVVTMATPFLLSQRRPGHDKLIFAIPVARLIGFVVILGLSSRWLLDRFSVPFISAVTLALCGIMAVGLTMRFLKRIPITQSDQESVLRSALATDTLDALTKKTFICSRAGDEADAILKIVSLLNSVISRHVNDVRFLNWTSVFTKPAGLEDEPAMTEMSENFHIFQSALRDAYHMNLYKLVLLFFASMCLEILHRPVGTKTATAVSTIAITSAETPPGFWNHFQTLPAVTSGVSILSHSQIYADETVLHTIADWICRPFATTVTIEETV